MTTLATPVGRKVSLFRADGAALAQIAAFLDEGAQVTVIASEAVASIEDLADRGLIRWERRAATVEDVANLQFGVETAAASTQAERRDGAGTITLVGGGPGDPGLVTVAGRAAIEAADVIITDRLAPLAALRWARPDVHIVDVAKVPGGRSTSQDDINRLLIEHAVAGRNVVRFKGGDNFVFGRGGEELIACLAAGIDTQVIPGVSSAIAAPAAANIPLTHRGINQGFTVISGHVPPGHPDSTLDYGALAAAGTSLVLLMAVRTLPAIAAALIAGGMPADTPAAVVADGAMPSQKVVRATLATIAAAARDAGIRAPAVTVIGAVTAIGGLL